MRINNIAEVINSVVHIDNSACIFEVVRVILMTISKIIYSLKCPLCDRVIRKTWVCATHVLCAI